MLKTVLNAVLGILFLITGIAIGYFYLSNIDNGASAILLIPTLTIVIIGIYILIKAGKSDDTVIFKAAPEVVKPTSPKENLLQKNNYLTQSWLKNVETRDKMRLLEMSAKSEEDPYKG